MVSNCKIAFLIAEMILTRSSGISKKTFSITLLHSLVLAGALSACSNRPRSRFKEEIDLWLQVHIADGLTISADVVLHQK